MRGLPPAPSKPEESSHHKQGWPAPGSGTSASRTVGNQYFFKPPDLTCGNLSSQPELKEEMEFVVDCGGMEKLERRRQENNKILKKLIKKFK